jgi:hypothetical protein
MDEQTEALILAGMAAEVRHHKDYSPAEKYDLGKKLEAMLSTPVGRPPAEKVETYHLFGKGKTRDKVASALGISGKTWEKLSAIQESEYDDLKADLEKNGKVDRVFKGLQRRQRAQQAAREAEGTASGTGDSGGTGITEKSFVFRHEPKTEEEAIRLLDDHPVAEILHLHDALERAETAEDRDDTIHAALRHVEMLERAKDVLVEARLLPALVEDRQWPVFLAMIQASSAEVVRVKRGTTVTVPDNPLLILPE